MESFDIGISCQVTIEPIDASHRDPRRGPDGTLLGPRLGANQLGRGAMRAETETLRERATLARRLRRATRSVAVAASSMPTAATRFGQPLHDPRELLA